MPKHPNKHINESIDYATETRKKVTFIVFDRKAYSLEEAIRSATADVRAGLEVKHVEMPALV